MLVAVYYRTNLTMRQLAAVRGLRRPRYAGIQRLRPLLALAHESPCFSPTFRQSGGEMNQAKISGSAEADLAEKTSVECDRVYDDRWTGDVGVDILSWKVELQLIHHFFHDVAHLGHERAPHHVLPVVE